MTQPRTCMPGPLIPDRWALPIAALAIGITEQETQTLIDAGTLDITSLESVQRECARRDLERLERLRTLLPYENGPV